MLEKKPICQILNLSDLSSRDILNYLKLLCIQYVELFRQFVHRCEKKNIFIRSLILLHSILLIFILLFDGLNYLQIWIWLATCLHTHINYSNANCAGHIELEIACNKYMQSNRYGYFVTDVSLSFHRFNGEQI